MSRRGRKRLRRMACVVGAVLACLWTVALIRPFNFGLTGQHRGVLLKGRPWSLAILYEGGWPDRAWRSRSHLRAPGDGSYLGHDGPLGFGAVWGTRRWNGNSPVIVTGAGVVMPW